MATTKANELGQIIDSIVPSSLGTAGQVLTVNSGATAATFADAGGGADLYAANESSPAAQPSATGTNSIAIGDSAVSTGTNSFAGPKSNAGGEKSFAASVGNNTTTYGAQGANSVAIGSTTRAMALASQAFGDQARATGNWSTAIGYGSFASVADSVAVGGGGKQVKISGNYILPTSDGTNGQVMTTNGSGVVTFADAGGLTGFTSADNTSSPNNTVNVASLTASSSSTNAGIAIVPKGTGSFSLAIPDGTAAGGNARGSQAIELSLGRSGADRVASGTKSIGIGYNAKANGNGGVAISGSGNICQGQNGVALGYDSNVYGSYSTVINAGGSGTDGGQSYAIALGEGSKAGAEGSGAIIRGYTETKNTFAVGTKDKLYTQRVTGNLYGITPNATSATISTKGLNQTVSKANFPTISAGDSAWGLYAATIKGTLHALDDTNNEIRVWEFCRSFKMHDNVKSAVGNTVKNLLVSDGTTMANTDFSIELSGSTRTIIFTVTGVASTNIRWNAHYTIYQTKYE